MWLSGLIAGSVATIVGFSDDTPPDFISRFRALGFLPGTDVHVERRLPFGGPLVVNIGGSSFALEREASACVRVATSGSPE